MPAPALHDPLPHEREVPIGIQVERVRSTDEEQVVRGKVLAVRRPGDRAAAQRDRARKGDGRIHIENVVRKLTRVAPFGLAQDLDAGAGEHQSIPRIHFDDAGESEVGSILAGPTQELVCIGLYAFELDHRTDGCGVADSEAQESVDVSHLHPGLGDSFSVIIDVERTALVLGLQSDQGRHVPAESLLNLRRNSGLLSQPQVGQQGRPGKQEVPYRGRSQNRGLVPSLVPITAPDPAAPLVLHAHRKNLVRTVGRRIQAV